MQDRGSKEDDRVARRHDAATQVAQHGPSVAAESGEGRRRPGERSTISLRVCNDEHHAIDLAVPFLERDSALDRLNVFEDGLRLHTDSPASTDEQGIPCTV